MRERLSFRSHLRDIQVFDILQRLRNKEPMVAIVAPSILAQFAAPVEKVYGAIKR